MLRSLNELRRYVLDCSDGELGRVHDFLIDDLTWTVRYLVADTRKWLPGRLVLISPLGLGRADWGTRRLPVALTREQVEESPPLDEHAPVSRQHELDLFDFFGWPAYLGAGGAWTVGLLPSAHQRVVPERYDRVESTGGAVAIAEQPREAPDERAKTETGGKLRSLRELEHYSFALADEQLGRLADLIIDDAWIVRALAADLRRWFPGGRKVLVAPQRIDAIDWSERTINLGMTEEQLRGCPDYDPYAPVNRVTVERRYDYHGRPTPFSQEVK